jgi:linoleate 9S-lipoxygenase
MIDCVIVADTKTESRLHLLNLNVYVPRDEQFGHVKFSDFLAYSLKSVAQVVLPELRSLCDKTINEFDTFQDVLDIYEGSFKLPSGPLQNTIRDLIPYEIFRELVRNDGERFLRFPVPDVIKGIPMYPWMEPLI